jgi:hypothetical protein
MPDPVAWTLIEPGWKVFDASGENVGRVHEVRGDLNLDIFDGLTIRQGILSRDEYVPAEHVATIYEGEVHLAISREEIEALAEE